MPDIIGVVRKASAGGASGGTPALVLGTANTAGVATTFIRDDDTILAFDATVPVTQAYSDAAATGAATVAARRDHKHGMPAAGGASGGTPALTLGTANSAGVAATFIREDDTILAFDVTVPTTSALADAAAVGTATTTARRDHKHGRESFATNVVLLSSAAAAGAATTPMRSNDTIAAFDATVPVTQAFADAAAVGVINFAARRDHKHGMMAAPAAERAASSTTPAKIGGAAVGVGTTDARDDHVHALSLAAGKVANTTITNTVTPTTGGVTFAAPAIGAGHMYRIRAVGQFTAASSVTTRNAQVSPFWGTVACPTLAAAIVVPVSLAQTTQWELEYILVGVDTTHAWVTGYFHSRLGLAAADTQAQRLATMTNAAPASTIVTAGAQTLDLRFSMSTSVAGDSWVVQQVTMERMA